MGDEQGGESHGAVLSSEAAGGADMVLVSAIEAFDELLEGAKLGGDGVAISRPITCRRVWAGWEGER